MITNIHTFTSFVYSAFQNFCKLISDVLLSCYIYYFIAKILIMEIEKFNFIQTIQVVCSKKSSLNSKYLFLYTGYSKNMNMHGSIDQKNHFNIQGILNLNLKFRNLPFFPIGEDRKCIKVPIPVSFIQGALKNINMQKFYINRKNIKYGNLKCRYLPVF